MNPDCSHDSVGVLQGVCAQYVHICIQIGTNVPSVAQLSYRDESEGPGLPGLYKNLLDMYYLVTDKYTIVYLECSCERDYPPHTPHRKYTQSKRLPCMMKLVCDQECDSLPRMSYAIFLSSLFFIFMSFTRLYLCRRTHTHAHFVSPSHSRLHGSVGETIASTEETG